MAVSVWIIIGIVFFVAVILILFGIMIWMLFFRKVQVLIYDSKGRPFQIINATKKGKTLWFQKKNWAATEDSIQRFGKKVIYMAQRVDENSFIAYCLKGKEIQADENWLEALNKSYYNSSNKFKFGFDKYKELISLVITTCFICIMVLGAVKYTSDLTPVEADMMIEVGNSFEKAATYYATGVAANKAIIESLDPTPKKEPPK